MTLRDLTGNPAVEALELRGDTGGEDARGEDAAREWVWNQGRPDVMRALAAAAVAAGRPVSWVDRTGPLWQVEVYCTEAEADGLSLAAGRAVSPSSSPSVAA